MCPIASRKFQQLFRKKRKKKNSDENIIKFERNIIEKWRERKA